MTSDTAFHNPPTPAAALLADYAALRERLAQQGAAWKLPAMQPGSYTQDTPQAFTDGALAWQALAALTPAASWAQWQSAQRASATGLPATADEDGTLLQADALLPDGASATVRRLPDGRWMLTITRHHEGGGLLTDIVHHLASDSRLGALQYRRYWQPDAARGVIQCASHFIGFTRTPSEN